MKTQNTVNGVFDALYDLSTKNDLQSEKIIELEKQRDELMQFIIEISETSHLPNQVKFAQELIKKYG